MKKVLPVLIMLLLLCSACTNQALDTSTDIDQHSDESVDIITEEPTTNSDNTQSSSPFTFVLNGKTITLPCPASHIMNAGFDFGYKEGALLETDFSQGAEMEAADSGFLDTLLYNISGQTQSFENCSVRSITAREENLAGQTFALANGITFGSSFADIKALYGDPSSDSYHDGQFITCTYRFDNDSSFSGYVLFNLKNDGINEITLYPSSPEYDFLTILSR